MAWGFLCQNNDEGKMDERFRESRKMLFFEHSCPNPGMCLECPELTLTLGALGGSTKHQAAFGFGAC